METDDNESLTNIAGSISESTPDTLCHRSSRKLLWFFRYKTQRTLFDTRTQPDREDLQAVSDKLQTLEKCARFEAEAIRDTGIRRVLKRLLRLADFPPNEFQLKMRSYCLLKKLTQQSDHEGNKRAGQRSEARGQSVPRPRRRSSWGATSVALRRSQRIARKHSRRSIRTTKTIV